MYKNFRISEDERKQILEMHRKQGYKRAINEDEESMSPESTGDENMSSMSPEGGNKGIKPEHLKVIMVMASRAFPTVRQFERHPFEKYDNMGGVTYYGSFNQENTPNLKKNSKVPYEGIVDSSIEFTVSPTGLNAGIRGEVRLNTFRYSLQITADEINKIVGDKIWDSYEPKTPGGLISNLKNQYIGIQNGVEKTELMKALEETGFQKS